MNFGENKFNNSNACGQICVAPQRIIGEKNFLSCEQLNWVALVFSPFLEVIAESPPDSQLKVKVRRFENGVCRITIAANNVSIKNRQARTSEFFVGKVIRGHLDVMDGSWRCRYKKGDMFYVSQFSEWKIECWNVLIIGLILPCNGCVQSDEVGSVNEWARLRNQLEYSDIERISKFRGGVEFLARCVMGCEKIRFAKRFRVLTMIFRNIQRGDLQSKQLAMDLGVTNAAICAYNINNQLSVSEYFRLLKSFKRYDLGACRKI